MVVKRRMNSGGNIPQARRYASPEALAAANAWAQEVGLLGQRGVKAALKYFAAGCEARAHAVFELALLCRYVRQRSQPEPKRNRRDHAAEKSRVRKIAIMSRDLAKEILWYRETYPDRVFFEESRALLEETKQAAILRLFKDLPADLGAFAEVVEKKGIPIARGPQIDELLNSAIRDFVWLVAYNKLWTLGIFHFRRGCTKRLVTLVNAAYKHGNSQKRFTDREFRRLLTRN